VAFEIDGRVTPIQLCHARRCQKSTGSAFSPELAARAERFRWLRGEQNVARYEAPLLREPPPFRKSFCRTCGSPLPVLQRETGFVILLAGSLDDDPGVRRAACACGSPPARGGPAGIRPRQLRDVRVPMNRFRAVEGRPRPRSAPSTRLATEASAGVACRARENHSPHRSHARRSLGRDAVASGVGGVNEMSNDEDLKRELERLRAENEALKAKERRGTRLAVSEKGGVSLYGLRRFPVTFYADEWERILGMSDEIRAFIGENEAALKRKGGE
jgi:hypothetical protein